MILLNLNGIWKMAAAGHEESWNANVPGTVASTLLEQGGMPDPFWRDNERKIQEILERDYAFERSFQADEKLLAQEFIELCCTGLDTLAEIRLNGMPVGNADNMHRNWRFDVKPYIKSGENKIEILFHDPSVYLKEHAPKIGKPYTVLRKAACMFGWDWGLSLPDSGIWRNIRIEGYEKGRIDTTIISQEHLNEKVLVKAKPVCRGTEGLLFRMTLFGPEGEKLGVKECPAGNTVCFEVEQPRLWWPSGYGEQPLYILLTELMTGDCVLDHRSQKIGLRQIELDRSDDEDGSKYSFTVNQIPVFCRGENMIIEDSVVTRTDRGRYQNMIENCLRSNVNSIRVWGGAYYPPEEFYDLCDEKGILVYQDLMFACSFYQISPEYMENVRKELEDNLARISHHACIGLFCGNNEIDCIYTVTGATDPETTELRKLFGSGEDPLPEAVRKILWANYEPLFLDMIPKLCRHYAPDTDYVPSSPSVKEPGGAKKFFDYAANGDLHYYLQYNGNAPYQKMRTMRSRFVTEIGFQSYPSMKTISSFTEPEDRMPWTPVMYAHQKCAGGNEAIELYMKRDYYIPKNFDDYIFLSQLQAGEIMRYSVEHFRRDNGYCRGMMLWQLNDCWPVVSWSGIDYYGRWKALQYFIRRFYEPVLVSAQEQGTEVSLWISNETKLECSGRIYWKLYGKGEKILDEGSKAVVMKAGESLPVVQLDYSGVIKEEEKRQAYLFFEWEQGEERKSGTVLFVLPREFCFPEPELSVEIRETGNDYVIEAAARHFVRAAGFDTSEGDCIFSDNYFDLPPGGRRVIKVDKGSCRHISDLEDLKKQLTVRTLNDVMRRAEIFRS
ncbi:MAG: glycoside hydrolase family 2 protein [Lachnospiraceae bacterium]|nr:glycoside hydrolase family 2 protein [Lachnospiraceae bacterium]